MATKKQRLTFDVRVTVEVEEGTSLRWIKRELILHLAGDRRGDGYSVMSSRDGSFDVVFAASSHADAIARRALDMLRSNILSDYQGTTQLSTQLAPVERLTRQLGPVRV